MARLNWKRAQERERELLLRRDEPPRARDRKPTQRQLDYLRALWREAYPGERTPTRPRTNREASDQIDALRRHLGKPP